MAIAQPSYPSSTSAVVTHIGTYVDTQDAAAATRLTTLETVQAAGTPSICAVGTTATTACAGNDARLSDTRTPTDATVTEAKLSSAIKAQLKGVCVHNGTSYPTRPSGFASVEFVGPSDPAGAASNGDTWVPTA